LLVKIHKNKSSSMLVSYRFTFIAFGRRRDKNITIKKNAAFEIFIENFD